MAKARQIPLRPFPDAPLPTVDAIVADLQPTDPLFCLRPAVIAAAAQRFTGCFPGDAL
jgi:ornithine decarboxylase